MTTTLKSSSVHDTIRGNSLEKMTKFFYIVDHFVPFPTSEYGGVWNVIAESDEDCFNLITDSDDGFNQNTMEIFVKTF